jgi:vancomycin aglycone glucosyltransferase
MRVLLSVIGSRGDVQPIVALAAALRSIGEDVRLCVPPDFREWIEGLGFPVVPIGPELRSAGRVDPAAPRPTAEQIEAMRAGTVATQFETVGDAARGCDAIVGATALQLAAPSIAESMGLPYVFTALSPVVLPSPHHPPPVLGLLGDTPAAEAPEYAELWEQDARRWNDGWRSLLAPHRATLGLPPVEDVREYVHTRHPWLAADAVLAPWPEPNDGRVVQTGAWILADERPLPAELQSFLDDGDPPVYFGYGSTHAPQDLARTMIAAARALGRRAILSRGWAELALADDSPDCIAIGDVNFEALFPRVAAVVHHGGAGTTTAAARAGVSQVAIPRNYDQHYFAGRIQRLGVGTAHAPVVPTEESLTAALARALDPAVAARARALAPSIRTDGAHAAAERLVRIAGARAS